MTDSATPCDVAPGPRDKDGYVLLWFRGRGRMDRAHRIAWIEANGEIPEGMKICHHCDNPACRNVRHLFIGTDDDNSRDKVLKGRQHRKLTNEQVDEIRRIYRRGIRGYGTPALAMRFKVSASAIERIVRGITWKHRIEPRT